MNKLVIFLIPIFIFCSNISLYSSARAGFGAGVGASARELVRIDYPHAQCFELIHKEKLDLRNSLEHCMNLVECEREGSYDSLEDLHEKLGGQNIILVLVALASRDIYFLFDKLNSSLLIPSFKTPGSILHELASSVATSHSSDLTLKRLLALCDYLEKHFMKALSSGMPKTIVKDLINRRDFDGKTVLHILLSTKDVRYLRPMLKMIVSILSCLGVEEVINAFAIRDNAGLVPVDYLSRESNDGGKLLHALLSEFGGAGHLASLAKLIYGSLYKNILRVKGPLRGTAFFFEQLLVDSGFEIRPFLETEDRAIYYKALSSLEACDNIVRVGAAALLAYTDDSGNSFLHRAAFYNDVEKISALAVAFARSFVLKKHLLDFLCGKNYSGQTALMIACVKSKSQAIKALLYALILATFDPAQTEEERIENIGRWQQSLLEAKEVAAQLHIKRLLDEILARYDDVSAIESEIEKTIEVAADTSTQRFFEDIRLMI